MNSPTADARRRPESRQVAVPNVSALASARVRDRGHAPFLTFYDGATGERTELSYATFDNWASKTANLLVEELEVGRGGRVATLLGNHWTALVVAFGCWKAGCCLVPLGDDPVAGAAGLAASGADAVFVREDLVAPLGAAAPDLAARQPVAVGVGLGARLSAPGDLAGDVLPYAEEVLAFGDDYDDPAVTLDDDALLVLPSGGTSPRAATRLTQGNLLAAAEAIGAWGLGHEDRILCAQAAHLTDGLVLAHLGPFSAGASVVLTRAFDPDRLWRRATDERVTLLALSPGQLAELPDGTPPDDLRCAVVAARAGRDGADGAPRRVPVAVGHGVVEATCASTLSPASPHAPTRAWLDAASGRTVGAVTTHAEVVALDPGGDPLAHETRGRLAIRGPVVMAGYDVRGELDEQALAAGWFATADRGFTAVGPDGQTHVFVTEPAI